MTSPDMTTMAHPELHGREDGRGGLVDDLETAAAVAATVYVLWRFRVARVLVGLVLVYFALGTWLIEGYPAGLLWLMPGAAFLVWGVGKRHPA